MLLLVTEIKIKTAMSYDVIKKSDISIWLQLVRLKLGVTFNPNLHGNVKI